MATVSMASVSTGCQAAGIRFTSFDFTGRSHHFALGVLLFENTACHGSVVGTDGDTVSDGIGGGFDDIGDFEVTHGSVGLTR